MGLISGIGKIFKAITSPLGVLEKWAEEPLNRWEYQRKQQEKNNDVQRDIERATGVAKVQTQMRIEEAREQADLEIRMQTEITRINAETEQWIKDKEFERLKRTTDAFAAYMERLTALNANTVRAIGLMDLELRDKAQTLILAKTKEYKALQDKATQDAEDEFVRIQEKFGDNERVYNIMISAAETKLVSVINSASRFLDELGEDIKKMNQNIDKLVQEGQVLIGDQLRVLGNSTAVLAANSQERISSPEVKQIEK